MEDWTGGRAALVGGASGMLAARPANQRPMRPNGQRKTRWKEEEIMLMDPGRRLVLSRNATGHAQCATRAEGRSLPHRPLSGLPGFSTQSSPGGGVEHHYHHHSRWVSAIFFIFPLYLFVEEILSDWLMTPTVGQRPPEEGAGGLPKSKSPP